MQQWHKTKIIQATIILNPFLPFLHGTLLGQARPQQVAKAIVSSHESHSNEHNQNGIVC